MSGINVPISLASVPTPSPRPAMPRAMASADDSDFERCNGDGSTRN